MLSPNGRSNRWDKAAEVRYFRRLAMLKAREATGGPRWLIRSAVTRTTLYAATRRRRDGDNVTAMAKAYMDGFTDAGLWIDDSVVTHLPPVLLVDPQNPRVEIEIEETDPT